jgi:arsenite methyltransferase
MNFQLSTINYQKTTNNMNTNEEIKEMVKQKYSEIALQDQETNASSCCGSGSCSSEVYTIMSDEYNHLEGYTAEADLKLGCGLPTQFAKIKAGDTVIDLGSGAGNDCFVARHETGESGKVIGIDFTPEMIDKARLNADKLNYNNVEFRLGDIENIPTMSNIADVVVSNCVMNLVPDKQKAFSEVHRILKVCGHFSISDIVLTGDLPERIKNAAEMYAGCVASAILKDDYLEIIKNSGFKNMKLQKEKPIIIPTDILKDYLNESEIEIYNSNKNIIFSITVYAEKTQDCCGPTCC